MGMRDEAVERPDISCLPVYKTSMIFKERIGDEIHLVHGHEMFGQVIWTHVEIWLASDLIAEAYACEEISMRPTRQRMVS